jgi:hypothetical protein
MGELVVSVWIAHAVADASAVAASATVASRIPQSKKSAGTEP